MVKCATQNPSCGDVDLEMKIESRARGLFASLAQTNIQLLNLYMSLLK